MSSRKKRNGYIFDFKSWTKKDESYNQIIYDCEKIKKINEENFENSEGVFYIKDLAENMSSITQEEIIKYLRMFYDFDYNQCIDSKGKHITQDDYNSMIKNMNITWHSNIKGETKPTIVKFGVAKTRLKIKSYPTERNAYKNYDDKHNRFVESALYFGDEVIVIHESMDSKWYLIICRDYVGWVKKEGIKLCSRVNFIKYLEESDLVISCDENVYAIMNSKKIKLPLGSSLPIYREKEQYFECYLPQGEGNLSEKEIVILSKKQDIRRGFLKLNKRNILELSFKLLEEPYSWGGENKGRDCSAYVRDVFKCFGIILPRNASEQKKIKGAKILDISKLREDEKLEALNKYAIAFPIFLPGHVMIYLGEENGSGYIIHDSGGFYKEGKLIGGNKIVVTDLDVETSKGLKYLDELDTILLFE
ncbi:NlpC/P60 family protein [Oceanirhabdus seepicola]|uniref:SH3 domain-containing protein n=1 Tax=Oceanirhabdus seepicola TaxID=2828781 RepID=A0A9J6P657_9CLOT|nr:NlpC/P60 family protein [Oceanirhabdus seepicola]MCM1990984.1 SH3 domain-containing protein [Oceanirhabdus seepicola]